MALGAQAWCLLSSLPVPGGRRDTVPAPGLQVTEAAGGGLLPAGFLGKLVLFPEPASSLTPPAPAQCDDGRDRFSTSRFGFWAVFTGS